MKKLLLIAVLSAVALVLGASEAQANHCVTSQLDDDPVDLWVLLGPASDYIGITVVAIVDPSFPLDVELCIALWRPSLSDSPFDRRPLECADDQGPGGAETVGGPITSSLFPDIGWLLTARLVIEVWQVSGSGQYTLCVWLK